MDVGAVTAWNLTVGKKKPRLAAAGLWAMTAFRAYLVVHNVRNIQKAAPQCSRIRVTRLPGAVLKAMSNRGKSHAGVG